MKQNKFKGTSLPVGKFVGLAGLMISLFFPASGRAAQLLHNRASAVAARLAPLQRLESTNRLHLAIGLPLRDQDGLSALLKQIYNPASTNYHRYLTPKQFTDKFGPTKADYQAVIDFFRAHGLEVSRAHLNRVVLDVSGSVADVEKTFHVKMHVYQHPTEKRKFYAPDAKPSVDLAVSLAGVSGLDNYSLPHPRYKASRITQTSQVRPHAGSGPGGAYMGNDFRTAYVPDSTLDGSSQSLGLLEFDGYSTSDINDYETSNNLPNVYLNNILLDDFDGSINGGEGEVSLDIEVAISMAPGLYQVLVYEAGPNGNWWDILNQMANDDAAAQLSCSWYIPGGEADPVADIIFQQMVVQGQSFLNASGDSDAYTGLIDFPGDTPYITQVGGTTLTNGTDGSWNSETVWNWGIEYGPDYDGVGSGGGISTQYPIPSWQTNTSMAANQGSTTMRNTPDVAMTADNIYVRVDGGDNTFGGTSCAAPLWAAFTALVNEEAENSALSVVGFLNPALYAIGNGTNYTSCFHDITTGNNTWSGSPGRFYAATNYDLCTGWGTPAGQNLIDALVAIGPPPPEQVASSVMTQPTDVTETVGQTVVFSVIPAGTPPFSYQWTFNGVNLNDNGTVTGSGGRALTLINVQVALAGTYAVHISNLYGSVVSSNCQLTVLPPYTITTVAGDPGVAGTIFPSGTPDGTGTNARFLSIDSMAFNQATNVYVMDHEALRQVTALGTNWGVESNWLVTTLAGAVNSTGTNDGSGSVARFKSPGQVAVDGGGNMYVADAGGRTIRKVTPAGVVTTIAGMPMQLGTADGTNGDARFDFPSGVAVDGAGNLYVADLGDSTIRKVAPVGTNWVVTTLAGSPWNYGSADGTNGDAQFWSPTSLAVDTNGNIYVADGYNNKIRKITPVGTNWVVTTLAGSGGWGNLDGAGPVAEFTYPTAVSVDNAGNVYVVDGAHAVRKVTPSGAVMTVVGLVDVAGDVDGTGTAARLQGPWAVASDGAGNLYVGDTFNYIIRKSSQGISPLIVAWGYDDSGQVDYPGGLLNATNLTAVAAGYQHSLALQSNGTVTAWGANSSGQTNVPSGLSNVVAIAAGEYHSLALKSNGTVAAWGQNFSGQTTVPSGLSNVVAMAAGEYHSLALKSDGTVVGWGRNDSGQITAPSGLSNVVAIAAGANHTLALKSNGTVMGWGLNNYGQATVPSALSNVVAIAAGGNHSLALKSNGTVVAWGSNGYGETNVPAGLSNVVAVAAGYYHSMALKSDGTMVAWGDNEYNQCNVSPALTNVVTIAAGYYHNVVLISKGMPAIVRQPFVQTITAGTGVSFSVQALGSGLSYQWFLSGAELIGATNATLTLANAQTWQTGDYTVLVSNAYGSALSANTPLTVLSPSVETGGFYADNPMNDYRAGAASVAVPNPNAPGTQLLVMGGYNGSAVSSAEIYTLADGNPPYYPAGTWAYTGSMNHARYYHTATLLSNGLVLVAGGNDAGNTLASAELYNPSSGTWTYTGSMNAARQNHTATLLPNGLVLVAGGDDGTGNAIASAELYDPATGTWTVTDSMNLARESHTATLLPNGEVLVTGGSSIGFGNELPPDIAPPGGSLAGVELYNPATGTWTNAASMNFARAYHTATLLPNSLVLVAGGMDTNGVEMTSVELYDPIASTWTNTTSLNTGRFGHTATLLPSGLVLVAGGIYGSGGCTDSGEIYDPLTGTWTSAEYPLQSCRGWATAALISDGYTCYVVFAGGGDGYGGITYPDVDVYDCLNNNNIFPGGTWTATDWMNAARAYPTATLLTNGQVLVAGGADGIISYNSISNAEVYNPLTGMWTNTGSMNTARAGQTLTLLTNGLVLVAGGVDSSSNFVSSAELYNPVSGTWSYTGSMNDGRAWHTATLLTNGEVLVAGGEGSSTNYLSSAELYNPVTGAWSYTGSMNTPRVFHTATLLSNGTSNGKVLVAGGEDNSAYPIASAELYNPVTGTWSYTGSMNTARAWHTAALIPRLNIPYLQCGVLVAGGVDSSGNFETSAEMYNPTNGTWTYTGSMNVARAGHTATWRFNMGPFGSVLVTGGANEAGASASAEYYDPYNKVWYMTTPMDVPREFHAAISLGGPVLVIGGAYNGGSDDTLFSAEWYDEGGWW